MCYPHHFRHEPEDGALHAPSHACAHPFSTAVLRANSGPETHRKVGGRQGPPYNRKIHGKSLRRGERRAAGVKGQEGEASEQASPGWSVWLSKVGTEEGQ